MVWPFRYFAFSLLFWKLQGLRQTDIAMEVKIAFDQPVSATAGSKFIGIDIDSSFILYGHLMKDLDLSNPKLQTVMKALAPSNVRVGGTDADETIFNATVQDQHNITIGPAVLDKLWSVAKVAGWDVIFDINSLVRKEGHWDPSNARDLLQYTSQQGYHIPIFQLGNEPNLFPVMYNTTVPPPSLAQDYMRFRDFLQEFPLYRNSIVLGPEVTRLTDAQNKEYLTQFLEAGGGKALSAVGVHHYICPNGNPPINVSFFTNTSNMELLRQEVDAATSLARQYVPGVPVWLDETSTTFVTCPGDPDLRKTYVNGFLWLDKLGTSAQYGIQHLNRHEMFYELVDQSFTPLPDYYLIVLYKRLVQGAVFKVLTTTPTIRVYAHCANLERYPSGAVTIYVINLELIDVTLTLSQFPGQQLDLYMLTPGDREGYLPSTTVALNGKQLLMTGSDLPSLSPKTIQSNSFIMANRTFGFVVIPHANVQACTQ